MVKKITTINVDADIIQEAKEKFINISEASEHGIKEKLGKKQVEIDMEVLTCAWCGMEGEKETREDIRKNGHWSKPNKLTWIFPYEEWICQRCLKTNAMKHTKIAQ